MGLKRQRSDSDISTSSSLLSSPPSCSSFTAMDGFQSPQHQRQLRLLFPSRTRKRHRDNRPSEFDVHQHTLSLLYSAQKTQQPQLRSPSPFPMQYPVAPLPTNHLPSQQSSLHTFWKIPSTRQSSPLSNFSSSSVRNTETMLEICQSLNCEDCDASLNPESGDSMDVDMDINMDGGSHACTTCRKQVCHSCAVSNLGAQRMCLNCAGNRKRWVGSLGWMDQE